MDKVKHFLETNKNLFGVIMLALLIPVTIALIFARQDTRQRAGGGQIITKLAFQPAIINAMPNAHHSIPMSVLAYDQVGQPIGDGVSYSWGISSTSVTSIGTLSYINGNIATFTPLNDGHGDIYVTATNINGSFTSSMPVDVGNNTITPSPTSVPNPFGQALKFTESNTQSLKVTNPNSALLNQSGFTIDMWVNKTTNTSPSAPVLVALDRLVLAVSSGTQSQNKLILQTGSPLEILQGPILNPNSWHHIAITYKPTTTTRGSMSLHVDGITYSASDIAGPFVTGFSSKWAFGENMFGGIIDELSIRQGVLYDQNAASYIVPISPYTVDSTSVLLAHFDGVLKDDTNTYNWQSSTNISFVPSTITTTPPTPTQSISKPGDTNGDGFINLTDLSILLSNWQNTSYPNADFNNDRIINLTDLSILLSNWGT